MRMGRIAALCSYSMIGAFALVCLCPTQALAQDDHSHMMTADHREPTSEQKKQANALVQAVRKVTAQFQHEPPADYVLNFGCVSGGDFGAMGMHFVNGPLVDGVIELERPEILLYEPLPNGRLQLTGVDYLVPKAAWEADPKHTSPPELKGQLFHLFDSPNRFGLDAFYTLHVWAWKDNPVGTFTNWNPNVSCDAFSGESR